MSTGIQGPFGNIGIQGPTGIVGTNGPQGSQGLQGFTGPNGVTGPTGQQLYGNGMFTQTLYSDISVSFPALNNPTSIPLNSGQPNLLGNESTSISGYYTFTGGTGINRYENPLSVSSELINVSPGTYYIQASANAGVLNIGGSSTAIVLRLDVSSGGTFTRVTQGLLTAYKDSNSSTRRWATCYLQTVYQATSNTTLALRLSGGSTGITYLQNKHTNINIVRLL